VHVLAGHRAVRAGAGERAEVDAEVLGELADRGLGEGALRGRGERCGGRGYGRLVGHVDHLGRRETGLERALQLLLRGSCTGRGRNGSVAGTAYGAPVGLVATDQGLPLTPAAGGRVGQVDLRWSGLGGPCPLRHPEVGVGLRLLGGPGGVGLGLRRGVADGDDRGADRHGLALGHHQLLNHAGER
jgi:hypothetical protein